MSPGKESRFCSSGPGRNRPGRAEAVPRCTLQHLHLPRFCALILYLRPEAQNRKPALWNLRSAIQAADADLGRSTEGENARWGTLLSFDVASHIVEKEFYEEGSCEHVESDYWKRG